MQLVRYRAVKNDMQKHQKTVSCLTVMGDHIWSGSADHSLIAWNIKTKAPVFELPQQVRLRRRRRERERERERWIPLFTTLLLCVKTRLKMMMTSPVCSMCN
jgi:hypothetical protein